MNLNESVKKAMYSVNNHLLTLANKIANGTMLQSYSYNYDAAGNQKIKTDEKGLNSYEYDYLNRLVKVLESSGKVITYTFDRVGN